MNMKGSNQPKLWNFKGKDDIEILAEICNNGTNDILLQCDCSCAQCKAVYKSYLEEKALRKVVEKSLENEKKEMDDTINEVMEQEKNYNDRINSLTTQLQTSEKLVSELQKSLQSERNLRMEDLYRCDFKVKESEAVFTELNTLKTQAVQQTHEIETLKIANSRLQNRLNLLESNNTLAVQQLHKYELQISDLEQKNDSIRIRLNDSDTAVSMLNKKNENLLGRINPKNSSVLNKMNNNNDLTAADENRMQLLEKQKQYESVINNAQKQLVHKITANSNNRNSGLLSSDDHHNSHKDSHISFNSSISTLYNASSNGGRHSALDTPYHYNNTSSMSERLLTGVSVRNAGLSTSQSMRMTPAVAVVSTPKTSSAVVRQSQSPSKLQLMQQQIISNNFISTHDNEFNTILPYDANSNNNSSALYKMGIINSNNSGYSTAPSVMNSSMKGRSINKRNNNNMRLNPL